MGDPEGKSGTPGALFSSAKHINVSLYSKYIFTGKFDYLYDKVGLYDSIKRLTRNEPNASTWEHKQRLE